MVRVLYLSGLDRSGTTLLERILGELPGVAPLGEVVHLWRRHLIDDERCGCGLLFSACPFWHAVGEHAFSGWSNVDLDRVLALREAVERARHLPSLAAPWLPPRRRELVREYAGFYARVYQAAAQVASAQVVVDSSRHGALALCLRWSPEVELRIVHVVPDSRDIGNPRSRKSVRPGSGTGEDGARSGRAALLRSAQTTAFDVLTRCGIAHWSTRPSAEETTRPAEDTPRPAQLCRLRYERLLANPIGAVRDIATFAGLEVADESLGFLHRDSVHLGPAHIAAGHPMRFATGRIPLRPDGGWRSQSAPRRRAVVAAMSSPLLTAYGHARR